MNNTLFVTESETISDRLVSEPSSDKSIDISPKAKQNIDSSAPMVSSTLVTNGCVPNDASMSGPSNAKVMTNGVNGLSDYHKTRSNGSTSSTTSDIPSSNSSHIGVQVNRSDTNFPRLSGEDIKHTGITSEGTIIVTNFRLFMSYNNSKDKLPICVSIGMIETIEMRDLYYLYIYTKHVQSLVISFITADDCSLWYKRLTEVCAHGSKLENLFCFKFFSSTKSDKFICHFNDNKQIRSCLENVDKEFRRMGFENIWRISDINKEFKLCSSYPRYLIVPQSVSDKDLESVANFRYSRRIPTVVWRHRKNGCVIARSSQPEVGWLGWRNNHDEHLLHSIAISCITSGSTELIDKKLLVLDARSYTAAVANRAKGGGCECPEYYLSSDVQFMSLANIHSIRKSYHSLRYICESPADHFNWLTLLDNSKWLHNISGLMKSALIVVNAIDLEERHVLVHCSDGWDRTPQIVALAELMLDPFYRTIDGFRVLIEREWIQFGHKFADRCGHGAPSDDTNERCPVFLQWLDCVHQLVRQFPCSFEFNLNFLIKLIQHTYSCLFGTFVCNNMRERNDHQINERTHSVWTYFHLQRKQFVNYIYIQNEQVLRPSCKTKDMLFWNDVYMPLSTSVSTTSHHISGSVAKDSISDETTDSICVNEIPRDSDTEPKQNHIELNESNAETNETESDMDTIASDKHHSLAKTRSCDNLAMDDHNNMIDNNPSPFKTRHCSDPNLFGSLNIEDHTDSERGKSVDILKYIRDLQTNGLSANRDICDRESNHIPSSRNSENDCLEDCEPGMSAHFSMLSTETLMNGNSCMSENAPTNCEPDYSLLTNVAITASTSTTELSNSYVASSDIALQFEKLSNTQSYQKKKAVNHSPQTSSSPIQRQSSNESPNTACNGYANGKHTRTPSSGCPATPNDEHISDVFPFDGIQSQEVFDIDGQIVLQDKVLVRLEQIIGQNKTEIDYLRRELYLARLALCQQLKYCNGINDETTYAVNNTHSFDYVPESPSLDSWVDVMPSFGTNGQNKNGLTISSKCDKTSSLCEPNPEANHSAADESLNMSGMPLNHL